MLNRLRAWSLLIALCAWAFAWSGPAVSQEHKEEVRYRCVKWQVKHIHDDEQAKKIGKTLSDLKCEVEQNEHNGHSDLKYRCANWRKMTLTTHKEAHQWEKWLQDYGFETEHHH